jgi:hypothetical protein
LHFDHHDTQPFRSLLAATELEEAIRELFVTAEPLPDDAELFDVENQLALLHLMASSPVHGGPVYLWVRGFPEGIDSPEAQTLAGYYAEAWKSGLGVEVRRWELGKSYVVEVKGFHARSLALTEAGTHLFLPKHGGPVPVRVEVVDSATPGVADPFAFARILRIYPEGQPCIDVRTGLLSALPGRSEFAESFRTFTLAALPRAEGRPEAG